MPQPTTPPTPIAVRRLRGRLLQLARLAILLLIVWLVHDQHGIWKEAQSWKGQAALTLPQIKSFYPTATSLAAGPNQQGAVTVYATQNEPLGYVLQTSPVSDEIVGYSGPTNILLAFDPDDRIIGMRILQSADTIEHVADVVKDEAFMQALVGRDWSSAAETANIDAVSGASLTSLAILEGISARLAGSRPSLRFPEDISVTELKPFFENAAELIPQTDNAVLLDVVDAAGDSLGMCLRTSPIADDEMGYQGPTDALIVLDPTGQVIGFRLRKSYDNEPYVGYVRDEDYFLEFFNGQTIDQLASLDLSDSKVEGVSGATMTSLALAGGLVKAARAAQESTTRRFVWSARDSGTVAVVLAALLFCFTPLRGLGWARVSFQLILIVYFGFMNGDLLSQAMFVGWAQSGVPWRLAPGLAILTAVAFIIPPLTKKQIYCHHICPFGAAQQLVRIGSARRRRAPRWLSRCLRPIPAILLLLVVLTGMLHWSINLAGIEPFDAFLFWIAGAASLCVAIGGLILSRFLPMAYCRYGCPTGAVLNFVRYHSRSDRLTMRDGIALLLLITAVAIRFA